MGVLDNVVRDRIIDREINSTTYTERFDLGLIEEASAVSLNWSLGAGFAATLTLEVTSQDDNTGWVEFPESEQSIGDDMGSHVYDIGPTGVIWGRIKIVVASGSCYMVGDYSGKRRH